MTGEKAIEILNSWDGVFIVYSSDEVHEAIKMATEALKQESVLDQIRVNIDRNDEFRRVSQCLYQGT